MKNVHKKSGSMQIWKRQQIGSIVMDKEESCLFRIHRPYFAFNAYQYDLSWQSMQYVLDSDNVTLICIFQETYE